MNYDARAQQTLMDAVTRLRALLARAFVGGDDPSISEAALCDLDCIDTLYDGPKKARATAFIEVMKHPGTLPGVSRQVVLARGQRFLFTLAMALEDDTDALPDPPAGEARAPTPETQTK